MLFIPCLHRIDSTVLFFSFFRRRVTAAQPLTHPRSPGQRQTCPIYCGFRSCLVVSSSFIRRIHILTFRFSTPPRAFCCYFLTNVSSSDSFSASCRSFHTELSTACCFKFLSSDAFVFVSFPLALFRFAVYHIIFLFVSIFSAVEISDSSIFRLCIIEEYVNSGTIGLEFYFEKQLFQM